ncbi:MAG: hypothetical protein V9E99_09310 [Microthrixaceae bacterium]
MTDAVGETSKDATAVNGLDTSADSSAGGVAAAPASSGGDAACGACGAALRSGDAFCENCGAAASGGTTGSPAARRLRGRLTCRLTRRSVCRRFADARVGVEPRIDVHARARRTELPSLWWSGPRRRVLRHLR